MKLNVDLSSAKEFPVRDDLRLRVFNKDNNITLCDTKLFDHVQDGHFPCSFDEDAAQLKHGANNFELEVYSNVNWKIYATQKIPDIHYFDSFAYEGYYDSFMNLDDTESYIKKTIVTSTFAVLMAHLINKGPTAVNNDLKYIIYDVIGNQMISLSSQIASLSQTGYTSTVKGFPILLTTLKINSIFLYDIYSAGLASPYSMILSGSSALAATLSVGQKAMRINLSDSLAYMLGVLCTSYGNSYIFVYNVMKALTLGSNEALVNSLLVLSALSSSLYAVSASLLINMKNGILNMKNLPKFTLTVLIATGQFLFDIFSAGLSSPAGMISSGTYFSI